MKDLYVWFEVVVLFILYNITRSSFLPKFKHLLRLFDYNVHTCRRLHEHPQKEGFF